MRSTRRHSFALVIAALLALAPDVRAGSSPERRPRNRAGQAERDTSRRLRQAFLRSGEIQTLQTSRFLWLTAARRLAESWKAQGDPRSTRHAERLTTWAVAFAEKYNIGRSTLAQTASLLDNYAGETTWIGRWGNRFRRVRYLRSEAARAPYRITVGVDGRLYDAAGKPYDTGHKQAMLVISPEGAIYAGHRRADHAKPAAAGANRLWVRLKRWLIKPRYHSAFLAGGDVAFAGKWAVRDGRLQLLYNHSGHYWPGEALLDQALVHLGQQGVDLRQAKAQVYGEGSCNALDYLAARRVVRSAVQRALQAEIDRLAKTPPTLSPKDQALFEEVSAVFDLIDAAAAQANGSSAP